MSDSLTAPAFSLEERAIQTVLVVDDSRLQRRILASLLVRWGMRVIEAESGEAALDLIRTEPIDLIFSDWMMPGMTGVELCRRFRALPLEGYVYFVLLTSKSERAAVTEGLMKGADDFLVKPVSSDELKARIMAADRIISQERELQEKNRLLGHTLDELRKLYDAVDRDLIEARKLQQSLVPRGSLPLPGAVLSFMFQPSGHVGGDLVGRIPISATRFGVYAIDVSGHGVASAMITARLAATLGSAAPEQNVALEMRAGAIAMRDPAAICARLNQQFLDEMQTEHYFTAILADIDLTTGRVRFAQAGHPNPLVQRKGGAVEFCGRGGLPIGLVEEAVHEVTEIVLAPGDRLFLYSDGVTDCPRIGGEMLEEAGLAAFFEGAPQAAGSQLLDLLSWHLNEALEGDGLPDDVSGILLERLG